MMIAITNKDQLGWHSLKSQNFATGTQTETKWNEKTASATKLFN